MRALLAAVLALAIAFAGCAGDPDEDGETPPTGSPGASPTPGAPPNPGGPGGDDDDQPDPITLSFATTLPCPDCYQVFDGATGCPDWMTGLGAGTRCDWAELPPEAAGRQFRLTGSEDPELEFFDACTGASATSLGFFSEDGDEQGKVPAGAGCAVVWDYIQEAPSMTLTIT